MEVLCQEHNVYRLGLFKSSSISAPFVHCHMLSWHDVLKASWFVNESTVKMYDVAITQDDCFVLGPCMHWRSPCMPKDGVRISKAPGMYYCYY